MSVRSKRGRSKRGLPKTKGYWGSLYIPIIIFVIIWTLAFIFLGVFIGSRTG